MMRIIKIFMNMLGKETPKKLGRWNIENCNIKIDHKIYLSNQDHCGSCGQYKIIEIPQQNK
jgi:hypothetical protein